MKNVKEDVEGDIKNMNSNTGKKELYLIAGPNILKVDIVNIVKINQAI